MILSKCGLQTSIRIIWEELLMTQILGHCFQLSEPHDCELNTQGILKPGASNELYVGWDNASLSPSQAPRNLIQVPEDSEQILCSLRTVSKEDREVPRDLPSWTGLKCYIPICSFQI